MAVIISEFEMVVDEEQQQLPKPDTPSAETMSSKQPAPKDVVAVIKHERQRSYRLLAH